MNKLTEEWIDKAEKDYIVAVREMELDPPVPEAVCFHSQQCIEKYIKAILQENNIEPERTHDLDILLQSSKRFLPELESCRDDLIKLSVYAINIRYPGSEVSEEEAQEILEITKRIRDIIRKYFNLL